MNLRYEGEEITSRFFVPPPAGLAPGELEVKAVAVRDGQEFREGYQTIAYDHIQERHLFRSAVARVKALDAKVAAGISVGYVKGAGDEVPPAIEQVGAPLTLLTPDDIAYGDLSKYTTIVTGIRAYQTRPDLKAYHHRLMKYVEDGGHLVVQYNKSSSTRSPRLPLPRVVSAAEAAHEIRRARSRPTRPRSPPTASPSRKRRSRSWPPKTP